MKKENLRIIKRLGKGKSGVSYLADSPCGPVVLKEMHDEKISYYNFSKEKVSLELDFEFSNMLLSLAVGPIFNQIANTLVDSFVERARKIYGKS